MSYRIKIWLTFLALNFLYLAFYDFSIRADVEKPEYIKFKQQIDAIMSQKPVYIRRYRRESKPKDKLILQVAYATPMIMRDDLIRFEKHSGQPVESIDYIVTRCDKPDPMASPEVLNRRRLEALAQALPMLFRNHLISYRVLAQIGCKTDKIGSTWFHGFIIHFREKPSMATAKRDKDYLADVAKGKIPAEKVVDPGEREGSGNATVLKVFDRNKNWQNLAVINDLTGSMSPYAAQIIVWHKLNKKKRNPELYVFFNDGDSKTTEQKEVGKTGGLYHKKVKDEEELGELMGQTLSGGFGGDGPENDIEATLFAIENCKTCHDIVLIADNYSDMRDMELIKELKKPVHVILCGARGGIHTQYLKLARETGGSVHTLEQDLTDLINMSDGDTLQFGDKTYLLKDGKFTVLEKL